MMIILNLFPVQSVAATNTTCLEQLNTPLKHSNSPDSGQIWGNYWSPGTDDASQLTACAYCHGNDLCETGEIGRPLLFNSTNLVGTNITNSSYWCSSCHYQEYIYYDEMVFSFINNSLQIPPEISGNATYGANQAIDAYFDHTYVEKDDASCKECHGKHLSSNATITDFMHDLLPGNYAECVNCHIQNSIGSNPIDNNAFSNSAHFSMNSLVNTTLAPINKPCWACHGNGEEPDTHPLSGTVKTCQNCHIPDNELGWETYGAVELYSHQSYATSHTRMRTSVECNTCHNNNEMLVPNSGGGNEISHYIKDVINRSATPPQHNVLDTVGKDSLSKGCIYCHLNSTNSVLWGNAPNPTSGSLRSHNETTNEQCWECHVTGTSTTFHESTVETKCEACHFEYEYMNNTGYPDKFVNATKYNTSVHGQNWSLIYCKDCHTAPDPTWEYGWKWCDDCHVVQNDPINESGRHKITADPANYTIGGSSVVQITDCKICHNSTSYNNAVDTFNGTEKDCRYCHSNPNSYYFEGIP